MTYEPTVKMPDGTDYTVRKLLGSGDSNAKLAKSDKANKGYLTFGLSLAPAKTSGYNVCSKSTEGCASGCLFYAGQGRFTSVQRGRIAKTRLFFQDRAMFRAMLYQELSKARCKARNQGKTLAVRLNVLSDLPWERIFPDLFTQFSDVQFYDYTKVPGRLTPANYYLTFSRSESNEPDALNEFRTGRNVAVVFSDKQLPTHWRRVPVLNGDETDLRFLDRRGIVGLYAKGKARGQSIAQSTGFIVPSQAPVKAIALTLV